MSAVTPSARHRRTLLLSLLPILLAVALAVFSLLQRTVLPRLLDSRYGQMSFRQMRTAATGICAVTTGPGAVAIEGSSRQEVQRRNAVPFREWSVVCRTPAGLYLIRFNANTGHMFGFNRLGGVPAQAAAYYVGSEAEARDLAGRYLALMGIHGKNPRLIERPSRESHAGRWRFRYEMDLPQPRHRYVTLSLDAHTGALEHAWAPAYAL